LKPWTTEFDGAPCAMKVACTVLSGGKSGDYLKGLPIAIRCKIAGHETRDTQLGGIKKKYYKTKYAVYIAYRSNSK